MVPLSFAFSSHTLVVLSPHHHREVSTVGESPVDSGGSVVPTFSTAAVRVILANLALERAEYVGSSIGMRRIRP